MREVLRGLPFLHHVPALLFDWLLERGELLEYAQGETIWEPDPALQHGLYVVVYGLVRSTFTGAHQEPWAATIQLNSVNSNVLTAGWPVDISCWHGLPSRPSRPADLRHCICLCHTDHHGRSHAYYLGSGGIIGLLGSLVGEAMQGALLHSARCQSTRLPPRFIWRSAC